MTKKQWIWLVVGLGVFSQVPALLFKGGSPAGAMAKPGEPASVVSTPQQDRSATQVPSKPALSRSEAKVDVSDLPPMDDADHMIGAMINLNGFLCARPTLVQPAGSPDLYAVQCITHRSGRGISNYLVNARTNQVTKI